MAYTFSNVSLNINKRNIILDYTKATEKLNTLKTIQSTTTNISEKINAHILYTLLCSEILSYQDYNKMVGLKGVETYRKIKCGNILEDTFSYTIANDLLMHTGGTFYPYLNCINFSENLDFILSLTFNLDYHKVHEKFVELCDEKGISTDCMSMLIMESMDEKYLDNSLDVSELCQIDSSISKFIIDIYNEHLTKNITMLQAVCNLKSVTYTTSGIDNNYNMDADLTGALRMYFRLCIANTLKNLAVEFYKQKDARKAKGVILSFNSTGIICNSTDPNIFNDTTIYIKDKFIPLPCKTMKI